MTIQCIERARHEIINHTIDTIIITEKIEDTDRERKEKIVREKEKS